MKKIPDKKFLSLVIGKNKKTGCGFWAKNFGFWSKNQQMEMLKSAKFRPLRGQFCHQLSCDTGRRTPPPIGKVRDIL